MSQHKAVVYPSIRGEFVTLLELAKLTNLKYSTLFFYQKEIQLLPRFRIEGLKNIRYKRKESIDTINKFLAMRKQKKKDYKHFLQELKSELMQDKDYLKFLDLAEMHKNEINEN